jgi:3-hydroxy-5-methyl-1-naphthoate 3-O-methyltransferase
MTTRQLSLGRAPLRTGFAAPSQDVSSLLESLGCKLFSRERTLLQHVAWSVQMGVFQLLEQRGPSTADEVASSTPLTESGADSLLSVLCALKLLSRSADARYGLRPIAREFFIPDSPYFIGDQLNAAGLPMPRPYLRQRANLVTRLKFSLIRLHPSFRFGSKARIHNQHARNLGACAAAVRTGEFASVNCLVDLAGGSGSFAIPFALEYPDRRIVLAELPLAVENVRPLLATHGLQQRVELLAMNAFEFPWKLPECDGMFIGNFLHGFEDETCQRICRESFDRLAPGGRVWLHEMIWNDNRDGPLMTALWHAAMRSGGAGRQRTRQELATLLSNAGYSDIRSTPTSGPYALVSGHKPRRN